MEENATTEFPIYLKIIRRWAGDEDGILTKALEGYCRRLEEDWEYEHYGLPNGEAHPRDGGWATTLKPKPIKEIFPYGFKDYVLEWIEANLSRLTIERFDFRPLIRSKQ